MAVATSINDLVEEVQTKQSTEKYPGESMRHSHCTWVQVTFGGEWWERKLKVRLRILNDTSFRTWRFKMRGEKTHWGHRVYFCFFWNKRNIPKCLHSGILLAWEGKMCIQGCSDNSGSPFYPALREQGRHSMSNHMGEICSYILKYFK